MIRDGVLVVLVLAVFIATLAVFYGPAVPRPTAAAELRQDGSTFVRRVRFEEDKVTCYSYLSSQLRCLRDEASR